MTNEPTIKQVREAAERIRPFVHCTPVDDRKLLFEPVETSTQESGRCQPFFYF
jgi:hypothetical protein